MKQLLTLLTLACIAPIMVQSQSLLRDQQRVGLFGNYTLDMHAASFSAIPGVPNCCPEFTGGSGSGFFGGLTYLSPIETNLFMDIRVHYGSFSGTMTANQTLPIITSTGAQTSAVIEHQRHGIRPLALHVREVDRHIVDHGAELRQGVHRRFLCPPVVPGQRRAARWVSDYA